MLQNGDDPKRWFAEWAEELSVRRKDRAWHEMHTLIDIFFQVGCYDQLNMGALAYMELVSRRLQEELVSRLQQYPRRPQIVFELSFCRPE